MHAEHKRLVELTVEVASGRVPVIAGAESNRTEEGIDSSRDAEKAGADALLIVVPYYNKLTQEGFYQHFRTIDAAISLPIIVYNIPPRSVVDISVDTLARLRRDRRNVIGIKDATANLMRPSLERMACGRDFNLLSGEDGTALGYMAHGGHDRISVTANVAPRLCVEFRPHALPAIFIMRSNFRTC